MKSPDEITNTLRGFVANAIFWWTDKDFSATNLRSSFTRSTFRFRTGGTEAWLQELYWNFLRDCNNFNHITISWHEEDLFDYEVLTTLQHDAFWFLGSFGMVYVTMVLQMKGVVHASVGLFGIVLSFLSTYHFYHVVAGWEKMTLLNFVSLFLITDIGADDVLVLSNALRIRTAEVPDETPAERILRPCW